MKRIIRITFLVLSLFFAGWFIVELINDEYNLLLLVVSLACFIYGFGKSRLVSIFQGKASIQFEEAENQKLLEEMEAVKEQEIKTSGAKGNDIVGWEKIDSQEAVGKLMHRFGSFHDSCIHEIHFWTGIWVDHERKMSWSEMYSNYVRVLFQSLWDDPIAVEVIFQDVFDMHYSPYIPPGYAPEGIIKSFMKYDQDVLYWSTDEGFFENLVDLTTKTKGNEAKIEFYRSFWGMFFKNWRAIFGLKKPSKNQTFNEVGQPQDGEEPLTPTTIPRFPASTGGKDHPHVDAYSIGGSNLLATWIVAKSAYWREVDNWIGKETRYGPKDEWDERAKYKTIWFGDG